MIAALESLRHPNQRFRGYFVSYHCTNIDAHFITP
jgi:hypothetical protein